MTSSGQIRGAHEICGLVQNEIPFENQADNFEAAFKAGDVNIITEIK